MKKLTSLKITKKLNDAKINPNKDTAWSFVVELDDPGYCMIKAADLILDARTSKTGRDAKLKQAITLLAVTRAMEEK
jgi:hypothetical protein